MPFHFAKFIQLRVGASSLNFQRQPTAAPRSGVGWWAWFESNFIFLICSESVSSAQFQFALPSSFAFATEHRLMFERQPTAAPRSGVGWWALFETNFIILCSESVSSEQFQFALPSSFTSAPEHHLLNSNVSPQPRRGAA